MKKWSRFLIVLLPIFFNDLAHAEESSKQADEGCNKCNCRCYQLYGKVGGGVSFLQTKTKDDIKPIYNPGYVFEGCFGIRECCGLGLEAEFAYRRNSLSKVRFFGQDFSRDGHFDSFSFMGNVLMDIPCKRLLLQPYIGGGVGYDLQQTLTRGFGFSEKVNRNHFAWQVLAGLKYELPHSLDLSLEYKFHEGGFTNIFCHSLSLCLTYKFGL